MDITKAVLLRDIEIHSSEALRRWHLMRLCVMHQLPPVRVRQVRQMSARDYTHCVGPFFTLEWTGMQKSEFFRWDCGAGHSSQTIA